MAEEANVATQESVIMIQKLLRIAIGGLVLGESTCVVAFKMQQIEESDVSETILPTMLADDTGDCLSLLLKHLRAVMFDLIKMEPLPSKLIPNLSKLIKNLEKMPKEIAKYLISEVIEAVATGEKDLVYYAEEIYFGVESQGKFNEFLKALNEVSKLKSHMEERQVEHSNRNTEWLQRNAHKMQGYNKDSVSPRLKKEKAREMKLIKDRVQQLENDLQVKMEYIEHKLFRASFLVDSEEGVFGAHYLKAQNKWKGKLVLKEADDQLKDKINQHGLNLIVV